MHGDPISDAADVLRLAQAVTVLTGAGVSKESGIPTYRDALTGVWSNYDFMDMASAEGFRRNPELVWSWYAERRHQLLTIQPNAGHVALARLERRYSDFTLVTQNVDNLHERAGSRNVVHLHGHLTQTKCFFDCQGSPTIVGDQDFVAQSDSPPACPHCGRWLRPDVVWFGEMLPYGLLEMAQDSARSCDVMLVIGTSGIVYPAAGLPYYARRSGATIIEINPEETELSSLATITLRGASGTLLPRLLEEM